ncbi:MAG: sigma-54-dependent transcriptional regulator [Hyphomicrobiales bacterium]
MQVDCSGPSEVDALGVESKTILVLEPQVDLRSAIIAALHCSGFEAESAADGKDALVRLTRGTCRMLILSAEAAGASGMDLLKAAGHVIPAIPVILISASDAVSDAVAAIRNGAWDYLVKPPSPQALDAAVRNALNSAELSQAAPRAPEHRTGQKTFITRDPRLMEVLQMARQVARSTATVLIQGESGTGKELLAAFVHRHCLHPEAPYVAVNCAALPESLAESELFGHEKGAFTGAVTRKVGKFELAKKGTLVLDEIGEMPLPLQAKLLRALQERQIDRVGGTLPMAVEARVVAITNRDLAQAVAAGSFREDLYFRVNVLPMVIPPLRERPADIPLLADHFLARFNAQAGKNIRCFDDEAIERLSRHEWRGNVRELENRVERAVLLADGEVIRARHLGLTPGPEARAVIGRTALFRPGTTVSEMERQLIMGTLSEVNQNRTRAAEMLGISIRTLRNKLREYRMGAADTASAAGRV